MQAINLLKHNHGYYVLTLCPDAQKMQGRNIQIQAEINDEHLLAPKMKLMNTILEPNLPGSSVICDIYPFFRDTKNDGDNFARSIIQAYLELVILSGTNEILERLHTASIHE